MDRTNMERLLKAKAEIEAQQTIAQEQMERERLARRPADHPDVIRAKAADHRALRLLRERLRADSTAATLGWSERHIPLKH